MISTKDVSKLDYLRHRPFLVVETFASPAHGTRTERKGWRKHPSVSEIPRLVRRISHTTMRNATVIIDLINDRIIKNRLITDGIMFDDEALAHYKAKYSEIVASAMRA